MSSRTRIYLYNSLQNIACTGNVAVARLGQLFKLYAGKHITVKRNEERARVFEENPLIPRTPVPPIPKDLGKAKLALWFWKHLPIGVQRHLSCVITREGRASAWRRSAANHFPRKRKPQVARNAPALARGGGVRFVRDYHVAGAAIQAGEAPRPAAERRYPAIGVWQ